MVLASNAQWLKSQAVYNHARSAREDSIHVAVMWPRFDEDGQISEEHPLGDKTPAMRMN